MESEWRSSTWGDEISLEYGKAIRGYSIESGRYRVYGSNGPIGWHSEFLANGPGVILGRKGAYRGVRFSKEPFAVIDTAYYVRPKTELDMRWLYYAIIYHGLGDIDDGSPIPSTTRAAVYVRGLDVPPLAEQVAIGETLGLLDDRIEKLQEANTALERIARALFKSWFIDFDPVRAKVEGREPEGMDAATAALFPEEWVETEHGVIPKSWETRKLKNICERLANGGTPKRSKALYWQDGQHSWFKTGELKDGFLFQSEESISDLAVRESAAKIFPRHAVLMALYGATIGKLGILARPACFNQAATAMVASREIGCWFLYLSLLRGRAWFINRGNGAAQQNISKEIVESYPIVVPTDSAITMRFHDYVAPLFGRIELNQELIATLSSLRDTLLPRLLSGKLRVQEAEKLVEAVA